MNQLHPREVGSGGHANGRAISAMYPKGSQMTVTSTGLATMPYQLAADSCAGVIAPGDCRHDEAPRSLSQRC